MYDILAKRKTDNDIFSCQNRMEPNHQLTKKFYAPHVSAVKSRHDCRCISACQIRYNGALIGYLAYGSM